MRRTLGIPAAIVVLVAFPVVIGQTAAPDEPAAKEAALSLNLEGDSGDGDPYLFGVTADGPPPTAPAVLRDSGGLHTAAVMPAKGCDGTDRVAFPATAAPWCLELKDVPAGHELTGSIAGGPSATVGARSLKLTVNRRDAFLWGPALVLLLGLILGAGATLFKSALRKPIRRTVLGTLLNENAKEQGEARIEGLTEFARQRLAEGEEIDEVIAKVAELREKGPGTAKAAREVLAGTVAEAAPVLSELALLGVARKEAERSDNRATDFYDGGDRVPHPAADLALVVEELVKDLGYVEQLRAAIAALPGADQVAPGEALARAELVAKEAVKPEDARRVAGLLAIARDSIETARVKAGSRRTLRRSGEPAPAAEGLPQAPSAPLPLEAAELGGSELGKARMLGVLGTALAILAVLALAVVTIKEATFEPKLSFSSFSDYFTLFSAALASSAAGTVVVVLAFWSPAQVEEG